MRRVSEHPAPRSRPRPRGRLAPVLVAAGAALGAAAVAAHARAKKAERRHPPIGRFVSAEGVRLHYLERGRGAAVVLLHGNGSMIEELLTSGLVERLARSHRVLVFDRPGFGYSSRPRGRLWTPAAQARLIAEALAKLGVHEAVVYGHSLGVQVAVSLALCDPGLVRGLVLASGYLYPTARVDVPVLVPVGLPVVGDVLRYTVSPALTSLLLPRFYERIFAPAPVPDRFRREFPHDCLLRPWHLRATGEDTVFLIPAAAAAHEHYASLRPPVTLITGDGDRIVEPARHTLRLHEDLPGSRLVVVPGAGHMIHHAALDAVAEAIEAVCAEAFGAHVSHRAGRREQGLDRRAVPNEPSGIAARFR